MQKIHQIVAVWEPLIYYCLGKGCVELFLRTSHISSCYMLLTETVLLKSACRLHISASSDNQRSIHISIYYGYNFKLFTTDKCRIFYMLSLLVDILLTEPRFLPGKSTPVVRLHHQWWRSVGFNCHYVSPFGPLLSIQRLSVSNYHLNISTSDQSVGLKLNYVGSCLPCDLDF